MALARIGGWKAAASRYAPRNRRDFHLDNHCFKVSDEVREAIHSRRPVVALESAIYTHGFPYPENVTLASHLESTIRVHGGVPATIGVIDGIARVGVKAEELTRLAAAAGKDTTLKLSRWDLGFICGMGLSGKIKIGGTTVASTMLLAHLAGIKVFATGGLGGVHRGGESSLDISADLTELGRTPVAVVSSGCKSFLDLPRTLEYLETQGVSVATFADGREGQIDFPAFWTRESGVSSPTVVHDEKEAAAIIYAQNLLSMTSGLLLANPIPAEYSIPLAEMDGVIDAAIREAELHRATGKANTPFILRKIKELTSGRSIPANQALIESNAVRGTKVAVELSKLEKELAAAGLESKSTYGSLGPADTSTGRPMTRYKQGLLEDSGRIIPAGQSSPFGRTGTFEDQVDILVAGSVAIDLTCDFAPLASPGKAEVMPQLHTSNPSTISQSIGGVGLNVATAAQLCGASTRLCSLVGDDLSGRTALEMLGHLGLQTSAVQVMGKGTGMRTAHYVAVNDTKKDLVLAMADMSILEEQPERFSSTWESEIVRAKPKWLLVDANWGVETLRRWISSGKSAGAHVAFEPVSAEKSARLFSNSTKGPLKVFPNHEIDIATPNAIELSAMHAAAREAGMLDRQDWWQTVNNLGIHDNTRDRLIALTSPPLVDQGIPQQSIQLLPFFSCLLTKLGPQGVLLTWLLKSGDERLSSPDAARYVLSRSPEGGSEIGGVYMRLFPAAEVVSEEDIVSVTGVGDTFSGMVIAGLTKGKTLEEMVKVAQKGSIMTLKSRQSVSPRLGELKRELEN
ncbi:hypothetical protein GP486_007193 [Trichoglossum hirsutum]|uniref:Carbohydrate kinase PfkB domain-containing protein n=1 Tax=Trichoglossum hirsutum TaxID=265104 RepID=A0A9P8IFX3_9PEZI|nr:hypothetical protein GP486_007193 [Trichoglossum hirsutum]